MYCVYVLYNVAHQKTFVGYTSDLASQLAALSPLTKKDNESGYRPWVLVYAEKFVTKKSASIRENELKSGKGREFIKRLINQKYR